MARTFKRREPLAAQSDINLTPLLDLAFSLLIIFMITTPLLEQTIPLELPKADTRIPSESEVQVEVISVDREGDYFWGEEGVTLEELDLRLEQVARRTPAPTIRVRADARVEYQKVIHVLDLLQKHNLSKIGFDNTLR